MLINVAFSGCRDATWEPSYLSIVMQKHIDPDFCQVLVGDAVGIDLYVRSYCRQRGIPFTEFRADWATYGKAAGPVRNQKMIDQADMLIAFWDENSPGTRSAITIAKKKGIPVSVYNVNPPYELMYEYDRI